MCYLNAICLIFPRVHCWRGTNNLNLKFNAIRNNNRDRCAFKFVNWLRFLLLENDLRDLVLFIFFFSSNGHYFYYPERDKSKLVKFISIWFFFLSFFCVHFNDAIYISIYINEWPHFFHVSCVISQKDTQCYEDI